MKNSQKNKLSVFLAVLGVVETSESVWMALTGIQDMVTWLTDLTGDIHS